jgi:hypothetical protein
LPCERVFFELASDERFDRLAKFVRSLAAAKAQSDFRDDAYWEALLDEEARGTFWWPTPAQVEDWERRWFATPVGRRWTDPSLRTLWVFGSLIDAVQNGEVEGLACRRIDSGGVLEFEPHAWPFGGTAWMHALIEAFGGRVTRDTSA